MQSNYEDKDTEQTKNAVLLRNTRTFEYFKLKVQGLCLADHINKH